jgi:hypothetical protein
LLDSDEIEAMRSVDFWLGPVAIGYVVIATIEEVWARLVPTRSLPAATERLVLGADRLCLWLRAVGG